MANKIYKLHSHQKLTSYMKKFSAIEKNLLFEISKDSNGEERIIAKTHTPDKSVVKIGSVLLSDIMDPVSGSEDVKVGLFSVDNFIASFKHFGENEIKLEIQGETVGADNVATEMKAVSNNLKISFPCASTSLFRYIDSTLASKIVDTTQSLFSFRIDKDTLSKISALGSLDSDNDILAIESKNGNISFKGKSFEMSLPGVTAANDGDISFYKTHLAFIDKEDSEVFVLDSKVIFKSLESETSIVIGRVE
jgi:hypothetical protein